MYYNVKFFPKVLTEVQNIKYYIKYILSAPQTAEKLENAIYNKIETIRKEPHLYPNEWIHNRLFYSALVKKYIIAYYIDEPTKTVVITAVRHTKQKRKYL